MNILTRGTRPFRIVDEQHDLAYPAGTVEFLTDKSERADAKTQQRRARGHAELVDAGDRPRADADELARDDRLRDGRHRRLRVAAKQGLPDLRSETPACASSRASSARR